jgi:hypothetical protein
MLDKLLGQGLALNMGAEDNIDGSASVTGLVDEVDGQ